VGFSVDPPEEPIIKLHCYCLVAKTAACPEPTWFQQRRQWMALNGFKEKWRVIQLKITQFAIKILYRRRRQLKSCLPNPSVDHNGVASGLINATLEPGLKWQMAAILRMPVFSANQYVLDRPQIKLCPFHGRTTTPNHRTPKYRMGSVWIGHRSPESHPISLRKFKILCTGRFTQRDLSPNQWAEWQNAGRRVIVIVIANPATNQFLDAK